MSFHLYGVGNALVDTVINCTEQELKELNIEKGVMTLIDEAQLHKILDYFSHKEHNKSCGGSAANTMIGGTQNGIETFYNFKVADDEMGHFYVEDLKNHGVNISEGHIKHDGTTGACIVLVTPDADRTMCTYLGITSDLAHDDLDLPALAKSDFVYLEGYLVSSPTGLHAGVHAREEAEKNNIKTSLTFSDPNMINFFREGMEKILGGGVDLLFCNEDEAKAFAQTDSLDRAIEKLKKVTDHFAVTLGPKGAILFEGGDLINVDGYKVDAIDTNGAGDLFAGTFLAQINQGDSYQEAGKKACYAASHLVTQVGPRLKGAVQFV